MPIRLSIDFSVMRKAPARLLPLTGPLFGVMWWGDAFQGMLHLSLDAWSLSAARASADALSEVHVMSVCKDSGGGGITSKGLDRG